MFYNSYNQPLNPYPTFPCHSSFPLIRIPISDFSVFWKKKVEIHGEQVKQGEQGEQEEQEEQGEQGEQGEQEEEG